MVVIRYETAIERAFFGFMGCLFYEARGMFYSVFMALSCSFMLLKAA